LAMRSSIALMKTVRGVILVKGDFLRF